MLVYMEFFAHMTFIFWSGIFLLLGFALLVHFDFFNIRTRIINGFKLFFTAFLPDQIDEAGENLKDKLALLATNILFIVFLFFLISIFFSVALPYSIDLEENNYTGPLGDLFNGLLTPVLTFLTFCGLLITIIIQNVQMKSTLKELELTRNEMSQSTAAVEEQARNSIAQKFDNNFYSLLDHHNKVMEKIVNENRNLSLDGLGSQIGRIDNFFVEKILHSPPFGGISCRERLCIWLRHKDIFLPFFLLNFQLLSFIDKNEGLILSKDEAKQYSNVLRALVPNDFLCLLFLNVTSENFNEYKLLLEKYKFFEHMSLESIGFEMFAYLAKNIDVDVFGDARRFKKYLIDCVGNRHIEYFIYRNLSFDVFGIEFDSIPKLYRDEAEELIRKIGVFLNSMNAHQISEDKYVFGKFVRRNFLYFIKNDDILNEQLNKLKSKIKMPR